MTNTFFISDTHFGHENIIKYCDRPFSCAAEMDEELVRRWNEVVKLEDKVYHLGDVAISKKNLKILDRLNGRKTLIAGNHDIFSSDEYLKYFDNIRAVRAYPEHGLIFSHIPVHPSQLEHRFKFNVHGHLHDKFVKHPKWDKNDERYLNICVENTQYRPISFDEILIQLGIK